MCRRRSNEEPRDAVRGARGGQLAGSGEADRGRLEVKIRKTRKRHRLRVKESKPSPPMTLELTETLHPCLLPAKEGSAGRQAFSRNPSHACITGPAHAHCSPSAAATGSICAIALSS